MAMDAAGLLGTLYVKLTADSAELVKAVKGAEETVKHGAEKIQESVNHITEGFKGLIEILAIREVVEFVHRTLEGVEALEKFSQETGVATQRLAEFKFAADKAKVGEDFEMAFRHFAMAMREARVEGTAAQLVFRQMNVNPFQTLDAAFLQTADAFRGWEDGVNKMGVAQELFGVRHQRFLRLLEDGRKGIEEEAKSFRELTGIDIGASAEAWTEFSKQLVNLKTYAQGLALLLVKELIPAVNEIVKQFRSHTESLQETVKILGTTLPIAVKGIVLIYEGWMELLKLVSIAVLKVAQFWVDSFREALVLITQIIETVGNGVVATVNLAIKGINTLLEHLPKVKSTLSSMLESLGGMMNLAGLGDLHSSMSKQFNGPEAIKPIEYRLSLKAPLQTELKDISEVLKFAQEDIWHGLEKVVQQEAKVIEHGGEAVKEAIDKTVAPNVEELKQLMEKLKIFDEQHKKEFTQEVFAVSNSTSSIRGTNNKMLELEGDKELNKLRIAELKKFGENQQLLTKEMEEKRKQLIQLYQDKQKALILAQRGQIVTSFREMNDSVLSVIEQFAGKQNTLYMAMFAASKAFAIAESIVKIMQGVAEAASLPWPLNLGAIASVVAATASIVTTISSTTLQLSGKKAMAMGGPVEANRTFLVGEQGPELFVPSGSGTIIPNHRLGGGGAVQVVINNHTTAQPVVSERQEGEGRVIEVLLRHVKNDLAGDIRDGRGLVTKALQSTFGLRRGLA